MRAMTILVAAVGLAAPLVGAGVWALTAQAQESERAIQGLWVLNYELSDDPRAIRGNERSQGQGRRGPGGGGGPWTGGTWRRRIRWQPGWRET